MKTCLACERHLRETESSCPFCHAPVRESGAPLWAVLGLASMLAGCSDDGLESGSGATPEGTTAVGSSGDLGNTVTSGASEGSGAFETTTFDTDDTAVDSSEGGGFIYGAPDGGVGLECDLILNDCPEGEKCSPWANDGGNEWNATRCVPIAEEPAGPGEPCMVEGSPVSGFDDCEVGSVCIDVDPETDEGVCEPLCEVSGVDLVCSDPGEVCVLVTPAFVPFCYLECDPATPEPGCAAGEICLAIEDFGICTEPEG